jgi:hypothetical protein
MSSRGECRTVAWRAYRADVFVWRYVDAAGQNAGESEPFEDRSSAEEWMGDAWSGLLDRGVQEVLLVDRDRGRTLYRMGLREA